MPFRDGVCWLFLTSQDKNWEGEKFHFPNFFNMCALRRTFRLRAMGALSQVKVVCSASCYQLASESLVKVSNLQNSIGTLLSKYPFTIPEAKRGAF